MNVLSMKWVCSAEIGSDQLIACPEYTGIWNSANVSKNLCRFPHVAVSAIKRMYFDNFKIL